MAVINDVGQEVEYCTIRMLPYGLIIISSTGQKRPLVLDKRNPAVGVLSVQRTE